MKNELDSLNTEIELLQKIGFEDQIKASFDAIYMTLECFLDKLEELEDSLQKIEDNLEGYKDRLDYLERD